MIFLTIVLNGRQDLLTRHPSIVGEYLSVHYDEVCLQLIMPCTIIELSFLVT